MNTLDTEECFSEFKTNTPKLTYYLTENLERLNYSDTSYGSYLFKIPRQLVLKETFFEQINEKFEIEFCGVLKIEPYHVYKWHCDQGRGLAINMLLSQDSLAHTIFRRKDHDILSTQFEFLEIPYKKDTYYLFNTQISHTVINFDSTKYTFTVLFKDRKLSYDEVYNWKLEKNI